MAEPQALFYFVAAALLLLPSQIHSLHSGDQKVLISSSGSTKLGEITEFHAEVLLNSKPETRTRYASNENVTYEFFWRVSSASGPWIKHSKTAHRWDSFPWRWSSGGQKTVSVYVRILVLSYRNFTDDRGYHDNGYRVYHAMNHAEVTVAGSNDVIIASLDAHQDSPENKTRTNTDPKTFVAGMVHLEVIIKKPQDLDLDGITFDWHFGDGSQLLNSQLQNVTHNFTTVKSCTINVNISGYSRGRYYFGTASRTLEFTANVQHYLEIRSSAGPKLPSGHTNAIPKNSPVTFEVKFKDPFEVITGVSIDWKFGDGAFVRKRKNTTIVHEYDKEECYMLWATIRVITKYFGKTTKLDPIIQKLCVRERVHLEVKHKHFPEDKRVVFNISCNGSLPVSFHWCVSRQCNLPPGDICSPTIEHKNSCSLIVNHVFHDSGNYCVNVGVMNDVSGTNTSLMVHIPNVIIASLDAHQDSPENKTRTNTDPETFVAGMVHLEVIIKKPQDLDLDGITFDWHFGDGSQLLNSQLQNVTHNFTTVKSCTINVNISGYSRGRYYFGTASRTLEFTANIQRYLEIRSSAGPKLPSSQTNAIPKNIPVTFEVKFKDPFEVITGVSIDWKFGDGALVRKWKNTAIVHEYDKEECYMLWATIRVITKYFGKTTKLDPIIKKLCVRERVHLEVKHKHFPEDKRVVFNISCNGSLPVSFHWCVSRQCNLPPGDICSPTIEYKNSCSLIVNHVFHDSGNYCINVGVMNDVSGTNTSLMVHIPGDLGPSSKHSTGKISAEMLVSIFIVVFLLVTVTVIVVRKWIYKRREKTERADFDFRDEDTASLSSVDMFGRCRVWGSCTKQEHIPLRIQAGGYRLYTL